MSAPKADSSSLPACFSLTPTPFSQLLLTLSDELSKDEVQKSKLFLLSASDLPDVKIEQIKRGSDVLLTMYYNKMFDRSGKNVQSIIVLLKELGRHDLQKKVVSFQALENTEFKHPADVSSPSCPPDASNDTDYLHVTDVAKYRNVQDDDSVSVVSSASSDESHKILPSHENRRRFHPFAPYVHPNRSFYNNRSRGSSANQSPRREDFQASFSPAPSVSSLAASMSLHEELSYPERSEIEQDASYTVTSAQLSTVDIPSVVHSRRVPLKLMISKETSISSDDRM